MKSELKHLNRRHFANILNQVEVARTELQIAQQQLTTEPQNSHLQNEETQCREKFIVVNRAASTYMMQKAKEEWILHGDMNKNYFHSRLRAKQYKARLYTITTT